MTDAWRKNNTCGACALFDVDFGEAPQMYGHCKMYSRAGQRTSNDSTCKEFRPLEGFEEKIILNVRTHVPDTTRRPTPRVVEYDGAGTVKRRRGDEEVEVLTDRPSEESISSVAAVLEDPGGGVDPQALDEAMLDVIEGFGQLHDERLDHFYRGAMFIVRPADAALKPAEIDVETLYGKFLMNRDRLRTMEQKINAHQGLSVLQKAELQAPLTRMYAAYTAFNTLFKASSEGWRTRRPTRRPLEDLVRRWNPRDATELAPKWIGGSVTIQPGSGSTAAPHDVSMDLFFDRVLRIKRRMAQLEKAIESHPTLDRDDKTTLADYLSKSHGSLTTLNILFRSADDRFSSK